MNEIIKGDSLEVLQTLPSKFINCTVTSPPYWGLRDYGVEGQLGLEKTFEEYIDKLCNIFDEVKRVLRDDGTCWVNLGDTYWGGGNNRGSSPENLSAKQFSNRGARGQVQNKWDDSYQSKSLCLIPFRFAIEMVNRGWICRNVIIWHKPNCMPSSVKDRFTVDFEYLFFFVKNKKYWFEQVFEPSIDPESINGRRKRNPYKGCGTKGFEIRDGLSKIEIGKTYPNRNKRTVWTIPTKPYPEAHFAVYPAELIRNCIKAGCPKGGVVLDPFIGSGTTAEEAIRQGKNYIGIELKDEYIELINKRLNNVQVNLI